MTDPGQVGQGPGPGPGRTRGDSGVVTWSGALGGVGIGALISPGGAGRGAL